MSQSSAQAWPHRESWKWLFSISSGLCLAFASSGLVSHITAWIFICAGILVSIAALCLFEFGGWSRAKRLFVGGALTLLTIGAISVQVVREIQTLQGKAAGADASAPPVVKPAPITVTGDGNAVVTGDSNTVTVSRDRMKKKGGK